MPCGNSRTIQQINQALREPDNRQDGVIVAKDDLLPYWLEMKVKTTSSPVRKPTRSGSGSTMALGRRVQRLVNVSKV